MKMVVAMLATVLFAASFAGAETTIHWWQFWTDPDTKPVIEQMVAEFERANPDITVELTDLTWANGHEKIVLAFASGKAPDVLELGSDWIAQFADNGHLADLSAMVVNDTARFDGWSMASYGGGLYGHPWILGTRVLFGNADLTIRAGYDSVWVPVNWADLGRATDSVTKLGPRIYGWGSNTAEKHRLYKKWMPFFWSAGGQLFSADGRFCLIASLPAINALNTYKNLHDRSGYVDNQRGIEDAFLDGRVGYIISGDWLLKRLEKENRDINLVSSLIPGPKFPGRSFMGGEFLSIPESSKHKEAALKLIRFVTSAENQLRFCKANHSANPSSRQAQDDPYFQSNPHLLTFIRTLRTAKHPPVDPDWVYIESIIEEAIEKTLFEDVAPANALLEARYKIEKLKGL